MTFSLPVWVLRAAEAGLITALRSRTEAHADDYRSFVVLRKRGAVGVHSAAMVRLDAAEPLPIEEGRQIKIGSTQLIGKRYRVLSSWKSGQVTCSLPASPGVQMMELTSDSGASTSRVELEARYQASADYDRVVPDLALIEKEKTRKFDEDQSCLDARMLRQLYEITRQVPGADRGPEGASLLRCSPPLARMAPWHFRCPVDVERNDWLRDRAFDMVIAPITKFEGV